MSKTNKEYIEEWEDMLVSSEVHESEVSSSLDILDAEDGYKPQG